MSCTETDKAHNRVVLQSVVGGNIMFHEKLKAKKKTTKVSPQ